MTKHKSPEIHIGKSVVKSSGCVKVLGIEIDSKLSKLHFIHWFECFIFARITRKIRIYMKDETCEHSVSWFW